jgi:endonuclease III
MGIPVEANIHRVMNRIGFVKTNNARETRTELESFVPEKCWGEMYTLFVGLGQQIC